jgi:hypothetical protein
VRHEISIDLGRACSAVLNFFNCASADVRHVHLVRHHEARLFRATRDRRASSSFKQVLVVVARIARIGGRHVHEEDQQRAALDVPEKPVAQPAVLVRTLDEAGDVRQQQPASCPSPRPR